MKQKIKASVYSISVLMMGVIGITGSLSAIGENFPDLPQYMIQNLISVPCFAIIPATLITGKALTRISKKKISIFGAACFLLGGAAPAFISDSFTVILLFRAIMGIGVGISQVMATSLNAYYFSGEEQKKVQGNIQAFQMLGIAVMVFAGGWLAELSWNYVFYIHLLGVVTLIVTIICLPNDTATTESEIPNPAENKKDRFSASLYVWIAFTFVAFVAIQIYSIYFSFFVSERNIGSASDSGLGIAFFALGGVIMGIIYNGYVKVLKYFDIAGGSLVLAAGYLVIAFSNNMFLCYLGSVFIGIATSIILPGILIRAGKSAKPYYAGVAISIVTCAQNLGQCLCSYTVSPLTSLADAGNTNFTAFIIGAIISMVMFASMFIYALVRKQ